MDNLAFGKKFGQNAQSYLKGRKGYCQEIFELIEKFCAKDVTMLDLGCGTGISTIELWNQGYKNIIGSDIDNQMLEIARQEYPQIKFIQSETKKISTHFKNHFDVTTAFGSFHWFCDKESISQIKKILKKDGLFFVINKKDNSNLRQMFIDWLKNEFNIVVQQTKQNYFPIANLEKNGFAILDQKEYLSNEMFSEKEAISYFQSLSIWSNIPFENQEIVKNGLKSFLNLLMINNEIVRPIKTKCIIAKIN